MASSDPNAPRSSVHVSKPPAQLPLTPPRKNRAVHPASSLSISRSPISRGLSPSISPQESVANTSFNASQGPVTMQTRVAVRDDTPHRFQIIPLREAKSRDNLPKPRIISTKDLKCRIRVPRPTDRQLSPVPPFHLAPHPRSNFTSLPGNRGNNSTNSPSMLSVVENVGAQSEGNASGNADFQLPLAPRSASKALGPQDEHIPGPLRLGNLSHTPSANPINITKAHSKQPALEAIRRASTKRCFCHAVLNKTKARACSEDLTRHYSKATRNCVYEHLLPLCSRDDSSWCATKRHAIYSDTLVLPLYSPEVDLVGPQQISTTPTPQNSQASVSYSCRHCTKPRFPEDVFGPQVNALPSRILTSSQSEQSFAPRKLPVQIRPLTDPSLHPSVPHLRIPRKARGSSAFRATVKSNLNIADQRPLKHPKIILNLFIQLDQALEEWDILRREYAEEQLRIRTIRAICS